LSDFVMLFLVIHEQTKLLIVQVITYDCNRILHLSLSLSNVIHRYHISHFII
jgi:hypothetical protein